MTASSMASDAREAPFHTGVPPLQRLWVPMLVFALLAHAVVAAAMLRTGNVDAEAGGGAQVRGQVAISLAASAAQRDRRESREETTTPEHAPAQETKPAATPIAARPMKTPAPAPKPAAAAPAPAPPAEAPRPGEARTDASAGAATTGQGAAAPVAGGGGGNASVDDAEMDAYLAHLRAMIEAERIYPRSAQRQRLEGTVVLRLVIGGDGSVTQLSVRTPSGAVSLDRAAQRMVRAADPFPPPPGGTFSVVLPVAFALQ